MKNTLDMADGLSMPIAGVTQKFSFLGRTGGGKSYAASKLAEQMLLINAQIIVLDVVGNWYGLRIPKDKKNKGFDILVFGGANGDIDINPKAGAIIAQIILEKNISAVIDISEFISSEQTRFAYDFLTAFFEGRKKRPSACHIFFEEAQELVPQNLPPSVRGEESYASKMLHAGERVLKIGRNYGIGASIISQRPQDVNKKVLNQTEIFLAFQMTGLQERKTVKDWVSSKGEDSGIIDQLPSLSTGQAIVWSPSWLKISGIFKIDEKITADVSATPEVGAEPTKFKKIAPINVQELTAVIADLAIELEANTPAALKKRIAELEKTIKDQKPGIPPEPIIQEVSVIDHLALDRINMAVNVFYERQENYIQELISIVEKARLLTPDEIRTAIEEIRNDKTYSSEPVNYHTGNPPAVYEGNGLAKTTGSNMMNQRETAKYIDDVITIDKLPDGERKVLIVIAQFTPSGGATREQCGIFTNYKKSSRNQYISRLSQKGYIETADRLTITSRGLQALGSYEKLPTGIDLQNWWIERLPEGEGLILKSLFKVYPNLKNRSGLMEELTYKKSSFNQYVSRLSTKELIKIESNGLRASECFFG